MEKLLRKITILLCCFCVPTTVIAQQTLSSKDMIAISAMVPSVMDLPADAQSALALKLGQMANQNGFGGFSGQFVLTTNIITVDKQVTATAPAQYVVKLEASFYVIDIIEQVVISETSVSLTGVDRLENKAVIQAINQIKPKSPDIRTFMNNSRTKIIDYYNTRIPTLITKAQSLADRDDYYGALQVLSAIPENVDQYPMVADQMSAIYMKMIDREATAAIREAKGRIAVRDYEGALDALLVVDPSSTKSAEAFALIGQIKGVLDAKEQQALAEKLRDYEDKKEASQRMHDDQVMLTKMQINAAQKVGVEAAKTESSVASKVNKWFMGKFR